MICIKCYCVQIGNLKNATISSTDLWINAYGTPQDGFKFRGSQQLVSTTNFKLLKLTNTLQDYNFCLKGTSYPIGNITVLNMVTTICNQNFMTVCRKKSLNFQECSSNTNQTSVIYKEVDETLNFLTKLFVQNLTTNYKLMFHRINMTASYKSLFSMLWYSKLPCFDLNGVTSETGGEKSILKSCYWRGVKISCTAIFNTFPTDQVISSWSHTLFSFHCEGKWYEQSQEIKNLAK